LRGREAVDWVAITVSAVGSGAKFAILDEGEKQTLFGFVDKV